MPESHLFDTVGMRVKPVQGWLRHGLAHQEWHPRREFGPARASYRSNSRRRPAVPVEAVSAGR